MMIDDDARPYSALVEQLEGVMHENRDAVIGLGTRAETAMTRPHPWFGELNCREWAVFQRVHDEDHIRHATAMLGALRP
jgi:hypothetical protein